MDGRTSEICSPLHKLIFAVDDPVLAYYFPPNHFNCRTTAIKLRNGIPSENYNLPEIPEAFRNNVGANGEIFTNQNTYIANTPKEVFAYSEKHAERWFKFYELQRNKEFTDVAFNMDNLGVKATHTEHNFNKQTGKFEKEVRDLFFGNGDEIILGNESSRIPGKKPDGTLNGASFDISSIIGDGKNTIKRALNHSREKSADIAILYFPDKTNFSPERLATGIRMYRGQSNYEFKQIIYIVDGEIRYYK